MIRIDERSTTVSPDQAFRVAADVERWPEILPHYRWVRFRERQGPGRGIVEMAAWREFAGPLRYPTWWVSEMEADPTVPIVRYRHIEGITTAMVVRWEFLPEPGGTLVRVVHEWHGPRWPAIRWPAANLVIGPVFVSAIARRTIAGVCAEAERTEPPPTRRSGPGRATGDRARRSDPGSSGGADG